MRKVYDKLFDEVVGRFGDNETSDVELRRMLQYYKLTPYEVGNKREFIEMVDEGPKVKYGIYNTDETPPGTHWFCVYDGYVYDPFGDDRSKTSEQEDHEENCGQRCVAYLRMCKRFNSSIRF